MKHILRFSLFISVLFAGVINSALGQTITRFAGTLSAGYTGEGSPATNFSFNFPEGVTVDVSGNVYVADQSNNRIRKITPGGATFLIAGKGTLGYTGDGLAATGAQLDLPSFIAFDVAGNLYFTDAGNNVVRKVNTSGIITTIAGTGTSGYSGDGLAATAATMNNPQGIAVDATGNVYISDFRNNVIRMVNTSGIISTIAGSSILGGLSPDGTPATAALLGTPCGLAWDEASSTLYFSDDNNNMIRYFNTTSGILHTIAGTGAFGYSGDGGAATLAVLKNPTGISLVGGNIYIGDNKNNAARKVNIASGIITAIAGNGTAGSSGDGGPATAARLNRAQSVTADASGNIYISDGFNSVIRKVTPCAGPPAVDTIVCATSVCIGSTVTATDDSSGGVWSVSNAHAGIGSVSGIVTGNSAGTDTISYSITNSCGTTIVTKTIVVNSLPNPITPSSIGVCPGDSVQVSDATIGGTWSKSATTTITISSTGMVHGVSSGGATISYTNSAGCSATHFVFVFSPPVAIVPSSAAICPGATVQLSDATSGGTWASSASSVATVGTAGLVTGVGAGTATISYTAGSGSCHALATITVNPQPLDINPPGSPTLCLGSTYTLSDATPSGTWSSTVTSVATIGSTGFVTTVGVGTDIISYTNGFGCARTKTISVVLGPTAIIPSSANLCVGATTKLSDATGGGVWTSSATSIATVGTSGLVTGLSAGSATITYTIGICNAFATVTVNALPVVGTITGSSNLCVGSNTSLSDAAPFGVWSSTNTAAATITGLGSVHGVAAGTTTISYTVTGPFCTAAATFTMTINALPNAGTITGPKHVCNGSTISLSDVTFSGGVGVWSSSNTTISTVSSGGVVTGASVGNNTIVFTVTGGPGCVATVSYPDTVDAAPGAISGTPTICIGSGSILTDGGSGTWSSTNTVVASVVGGVVTGLAIGTSTISYAIGSCAATMVVTVIPSPAAIVPSSAAICTGSTVNLSDATGSGTWGSSNTLSATVVSGLVSGVATGTATITYTVGTCYAIANVTVNPTPAAITPLGAVSVCVGSVTALSDATGGGNWSSAATTTATVVGGSVTGVSVGSVNISYTNIFGCFAIKPVTVNNAPTAIIPANPSVCAGSTIDLSDAISGGGWTSNATAVATVSSGTVTGVSAGTATISYAIGTCFSVATVTVNAVPASINPAGPISVCAGGGTTTLSDVSAGAWSSGNTTIATVTGGGVVSGVGSGSVNISYTNAFGCFVIKAISVNTAPTPITPANPTVCVGSSTNLSDATGGGGWASSATAIATIGSSGTVTGVTAGTTTITYNIGTCNATTTLTVNPLPVAGSIIGPSTLCTSASTTLSDASLGGAWSSSNTAVATIGAGTGIVNGLISGTTTISYTVTNSCGTARTTMILTVNSTPSAGVITGPSSVCAGTFTTLSDAVTGGTWSASNGKATIGGGGLLTGVSPGIDTITYTVTTPCGTASTTKTVSVGAFLTAGSISGGSSLCAGTTLMLSDPAAGGVWSSSNTSASVSGVGLVTGLAGGIDTISFTVTAGCGTAVATHTVTVKPLADAGVVTGPSLMCAGTVALFSDAAGGGAWTVTNSKATITGTGLLTAISPGLDTVVYSVTNSCGTIKSTEVLTIGAFLSAGTITGASSVCAGSSIGLSDLFTGGVWSSGNTSLATVGTSGIVTGVSGGLDTISYTVTAACGSAVTTHTVTVNPLPNAGTITGPSAVCLGSTITLNDVALGGVWSASNGHATITGGGLVTPVTIGVDTITYKVTNVCGTASATQVVTVGTALTAGTITGATSVCAGSSVLLSDSAPGGVWSSSNTAVATVGTSGMVTGTGGGIDTISYTFTNVCGSAVATATITVNPLANAGSITGPGSLCLGSSPVTYSDGAPSGIWGISNGHASITGGGVVTPVSSGTDTISYSVTNGCGTVSALKVVTIGTTPTAGSITGPLGICLGSSVTLTDGVSGGVWSSSTTTIATVGTSGIVTGVSVGKDVIGYTVTNGCGTASTTVTVSVDLVPNAGTIIGPTSLCAGTFTIYTDAATGGVWSSSNSSATITSLGGVLNAITPLTLDTVLYTVTNGCGTAVAFKPISIGIFFTAGSITGPSVICTGVSSALTDAAGGGVWSSSNAHATISGGGLLTGITPGVDTISYTITASCGVAATSTTITINPSPNPGAIIGSSSVCVGSLVMLTDAVTGGTWSSGNANATVTTGGIVTGIFPGLDTISYTVSNSCGIAAATKVMTINTITGPPAITGASSVCVGASVALSDAMGGGVWSSVNTAVATVGTNGVVTGVNAATDIISYTVASACGVSSVTTTITVNPLPNPGVIAGTDTICIGSTTNLTDGVPGGVWTAGNGNATVVGGVVTGILVGTDPISYTVSNGCGSASAIAIVDITTTPVSGTISGPSSVCVGSGITLTDPVPGGVWLTANAFAVVASPGIIDGVTVGIDTIFYQVSNACGTSVASKIIPVNPVPVVTPIIGAEECTGTTATFTDGVGGGVWTSSNPLVATIGVSSGIVNGVAPGTTTITYTVTNVFGCPTSVTYNDTVVATPIIPAIGGSTNACIGSVTLLNDAFGGGVWSSSNTAVATIDPSLGNLTGVTAGTTVISYAVINICGSSTVARTETINPSPVVAGITGATSLCVGSTTVLNDVTLAGVWSSDATTIATVGSGTGVVTGMSAGTANIMYTVTNGFGCSTTVSQGETINASPVVAGISGADHQCVGSIMTLTESTGGGIWSSSNTAVAAVGSTGVVTGVAAGNAVIMYSVSGFGCTTTVGLADTVVALPVVASITGSSNACVGATTALNDITPGGVWMSSNTTIATIDAGTGVVTGVATGSVTIVYSVTDIWGCMSSVSSVITVNPIPAVAPITGASSVCAGQTILLTDATAGGTWSSTNTGIATISGTGVVTTLSAGTVDLLYTITGIGGCTNVSTTSITVAAPMPTAVILPAGSATLCHGTPVYLHVAASGGIITSYQWLYNGAVITGATNSGYTTNTAGTFSVVIGNGVCSETLTATKIAAPPDAVIFFTAPDILYTGSFATYQWYLNGIAIPGATSASIKEASGGLYTVVVTDGNGCNDTSFSYKINGGSAAGVNSVTSNSDIKVYPNPATSTLHIDAAQHVNVSVFSIDGKMLLQQKDATNLDISGLANGMYMIMIYDENNLLLKTAKFAKVE